MIKRLMLLLMSSLLSIPLYPYVYGYTRLYRADIDMTIDIVYDIHIPVRNLSHDSMYYDLCGDLKGGLYPTERALVESLERLNQTHPQDTTVIWESWGDRPGFYPEEVHLLTYPGRLVEHRLRNLRFIHSDTWRSEYPGLMVSLLDGSLLLQRIDRDAIIRRSGQDTWDQFQTLVQSTTQDLVNAYRPIRPRLGRSHFGDSVYKKNFFGKSPYTELADIEMLSHILASPHRRVVVYAGGYHGRNISNFLRCYTPCEVVTSSIDDHSHEMNAERISQISIDHTQPRQTQRPQSRPSQSWPNTPSFTRPTMPTGSYTSSQQFPNLLTKRGITVGSALLFAGIATASYYEKQRTPTVGYGTIVSNKLFSTAKYSALPLAMWYLLSQTAKS